MQSHIETKQNGCLILLIFHGRVKQVKIWWRETHYQTVELTGMSHNIYAMVILMTFIFIIYFKNGISLRKCLFTHNTQSVGRGKLTTLFVIGIRKVRQPWPLPLVTSGFGVEAWTVQSLSHCRSTTASSIGVADIPSPEICKK